MLSHLYQNFLNSKFVGFFCTIRYSQNFTKIIFRHVKPENWFLYLTFGLPFTPFQRYFWPSMQWYGCLGFFFHYEKNIKTKSIYDRFGIGFNYAGLGIGEWITRKSPVWRGLNLNFNNCHCWPKFPHVCVRQRKPRDRVWTPFQVIYTDLRKHGGNR